MRTLRWWICFPVVAAAYAADPAPLPVNLRADRIELDQRSGVSRYLGHVVLTQGQTQLTADRAEARRGDTGLQRITAQGQPVTFRDQLPDGSGLVEGEAREADYDAVARRIELREAIEIRRGQDRVRGGRATYDIEPATLHAETANGQRVTAAVEPKRPDTPDKTP